MTSSSDMGPYRKRAERLKKQISWIWSRGGRSKGSTIARKHFLVPLQFQPYVWFITQVVPLLSKRIHSGCALRRLSGILPAVSTCSNVYEKFPIDDKLRIMSKLPQSGSAVEWTGKAYGLITFYSKKQFLYIRQTRMIFLKQRKFFLRVNIFTDWSCVVRKRRLR